AIRPNQISGQNITYGDREGHIAVFYGGNTPVHANGDRASWSGIVRGDTSATLWTRLHGFDDFPRTVDPPSGWVQNANDPPWWATFPVQVHPGDYPSYIASRTLVVGQLSGSCVAKECPAASEACIEYLTGLNGTNLLIAYNV